MNCKLCGDINIFLLWVEDYQPGNIFFRYCPACGREIIKQDKTDIKKWEEEFEEFYKEYPRKEGKANALKKYLIYRRDGEKYEDIQAGVKRYAKHVEQNNIEKGFVRLFSTWMNQRGWEDEYVSLKVNKYEQGEKEKGWEFLEQ